MSENLIINERLDIRSLDCPMPILKTKAQLARMSSGQHLEITADNKEFIKEIHMLSTQLGHTILEENTEGEILTYIIKKR
ncbi:MAG: sulfurtransferase TusA family protein [Pseudomonadota bacterium]